MALRFIEGRPGRAGPAAEKKCLCVCVLVCKKGWVGEEIRERERNQKERERKRNQNERVRERK